MAEALIQNTNGNMNLQQLLDLGKPTLPGRGSFRGGGGTCLKTFWGGHPYSSDQYSILKG